MYNKRIEKVFTLQMASTEALYQPSAVSVLSVAPFQRHHKRYHKP